MGCELLNGKKVLGVLAHPDDEVIFGWPIFQDRSIKRYLYCVCNDSERKGPGREKSLIDVCEKYEIQLMMVGDAPVEFYRLPTRFDPVTLKNVTCDITKRIAYVMDAVAPDFVFTHNPVGEYGNGDHRLLFNLVVSASNIDSVLFTDHVEENKSHVSSPEIPLKVRKAFYTDKIGVATLDLQFYMDCMKIYGLGWTWKKDLPDGRQRHADVYRF